ncbi:MAG: hypothetical protein EA382_01735, partial [Spirochaetaceae bacterium]
PRDLPITWQEFIQAGPQQYREPDDEDHDGSQHWALYFNLATSTGHLFWIDFGDDVSGTVRVDPEVPLL